LCSNCNQRMTGDALWCQACGFYSSLGTFVETQVEDTRSAADEAVYTRDWIRCAVAGSIVILLVSGCSIAARFLTAAYSAERFWYSIPQVGVGCVMLLSAHLAASVWGLLHASDVRITAIVTNPIDLWRVTFEQLPKSWRRLSIGGGGLLAILLGLTVVEGVTLSHLTGTRSIPPKPKLFSSLVGQATAAARAQADGQPQPQSLEEAIEQFADQGEEFTEGAIDDIAAFNPWDKNSVDEEDEAGETESEDADAVRPEVTVTCVIVGYTVGDNGRIHELLTAAMHRGRLTYAATVSDGVKERLPVTVAKQLQQLVQKKPPIVCPTAGRKVVWVRPAATCQIDCRGVRLNGELVGAVFGDS